MVSIRGPLAGILIGVVLLAACAPAAPSPQSILDKAAQDALDLKSVRFALVRDGPPVALDPATGTRFAEASGSYASPDRVRARLKAQVGGLLLGLEMIWLPEAVYASNPLTGTFIKLQARPSFEAAALFGRDGVPGILKNGLRDLTLVGTEALDGVDVHHLRGHADGDRLRPLTGGAVVAGSHAVDIWVEVATSHLRRLVAREPDGVAGWQLDLSDFDKPVEIKAP